jgi:toxin ParE1/3/4
MAVELIWHPEARKDLLDIYATVGLEYPDAAERLYTAIEARVNRLVQYPRRGPRRPDIRAATRMLVEGPYLIFYETQPDTDEGPVETVGIVRVVDGRRDLTALI